jgi:hypothetical protein
MMIEILAPIGGLVVVFCMFWFGWGRAGRGM